MTEAELDDARAKAEIVIQNTLLNLEADTGCSIDQVNVDTRNFSRLDVEIFFREPR